MLLLRRQLLLGKEKREYIDSWTDFLWENKISELSIKNNVTIMFMQMEKLLRQSEKSTSEIGIKFFVRKH